MTRGYLRSNVDNDATSVPGLEDVKRPALAYLISSESERKRERESMKAVAGKGAAAGGRTKFAEV